MQKLAFLLFISICILQCGQPRKSARWLVIGDDLAVGPNGWVTELQAQRGGGTLLNVSREELTASFALNRDRELNASEQIADYLRRAYAEMGGLNVIVIALGLNDCRDEFVSRDEDRLTGYTNLFDRLEAFFADRGQDRPKVIVATPPPLPDQSAGSGFATSGECLAMLSNNLREMVTQRGYCLVDWQAIPPNLFPAERPSVGQLSPAGNRMVASRLLQTCN
ncbi:MAG: hypothetical protein AAGF87_04500 [Bacteroidota bacterium]